MICRKEGKRRHQRDKSKQILWSEQTKGNGDGKVNWHDELKPTTYKHTIFKEM